MPITQADLDELWDFSDPVVSEERFRARAGDPELRTQLARALGLQARFDEAEAELRAVEASGAAGDHPVVGARIALERGRLANSRGDREAARPLFETARGRAHDCGAEFLEVDALHMLGIADPDNAADHTAAALAIALGSDDPRTRRWAVSLHNNLGWARFDGADLAGALVEFDAAFRAALRWGTDDQRHWARWAIARTYRELGRTEEALALQEELLRERPDDDEVLDELRILRAAR
ncbi:hypothetical protein [Galbitalea soli]|uniref:hypothetical protein n=1 Tax=Galbitalea soli TaxID=1268042 RepID=UPI001815483F|nr:hypothetical protein [Galbitalea soli]NYJ31196.1 tetratricopeptide (TPR) repeat protein [Galbitalea soli]